MKILCSELPTFALLCERFGEDDYRGRRLRLRSDGYDSAVKNLRLQITGTQHRDPENWNRAQVIKPELLSRYEKMKADVSPQEPAIER